MYMECGTKSSEWIIENSWRNRTGWAGGGFSYRRTCRRSFTFFVTLSLFGISNAMTKTLINCPKYEKFCTTFNFIIHSLSRIHLLLFLFTQNLIVALRWRESRDLAILYHDEPFHIALFFYQRYCFVKGTIDPTSLMLFAIWRCNVLRAQTRFGCPATLPYIVLSSIIYCTGSLQLFLFPTMYYFFLRLFRRIFSFNFYSKKLNLSNQ